MNAPEHKHLREGFTTGSAAAAAAFAAVLQLLPPGRALQSAAIALPPFDEDKGALRQRCKGSLEIEIATARALSPTLAAASVIKDGGDDPDATHGARIVVFASTCAFAGEDYHARPDAITSAWHALFAASARSGFVGPVHIGSGQSPEGAPGHNPVFLYGGAGVGRVTLPGLPVLPGEPAINPEPRRQITFAARQAATQAAYHGPLHLLVCVEQGERIARYTLNERLGIRGGISILGTGGIVRPYSHDAWTGTIAQGVSVAAALGLHEILFTTGRRSERLALELLPHLPPQAAVQAADYAAFAVRTAAERGFRRVHWACFPGKLLKLAQGLEWTHAKSAPADIDMLAGLCGQQELAGAIRAMPTAAGAFALLEASGGEGDQVALALARKAAAHLRRWLNEAGAQNCALNLSVFSTNERLLLSLYDM